jgi:hypothetical protein
LASCTSHSSATFGGTLQSCCQQKMRPIALHLACLISLAMGQPSDEAAAYSETEKSVLEGVVGLEDELSHSNTQDTVISSSGTVMVKEEKPQKGSQGAAKAIKVDDVQLPMGDINILYISDMHGWVASHSVHEPHFDADLGDILSFYEHVKAHCDDLGNDLFLVANGDFAGGTAFPFGTVLEFLQRLPIDVLTLGEDDISSVEKVQFLQGGQLPGVDADDSGMATTFVDFWGYKLVTSNLVSPDKSQTFSKSRFSVLEGGNSGRRILTLSFLDDNIRFGDSELSNYIFLEDITDAVRSPWYKKRIVAGCPLGEEVQGENSSHGDAWYDAILIIGHFDMESDCAVEILDSIRDLCGAEVPVQFLAGHTHYRGAKSLDDNAHILEGGGYLDTISFVSFPVASTVQNTIADKEKGTFEASSSTTSTNDLFQHTFIDANLELLRSVLNMDEISYEGFQTPNGQNLSDYIHSTEEKLGLMSVLGCAPHMFYVERNDGNETDTLLSLYINEIVPRQLLGPLVETNSGWYNVSLQDEGEAPRGGIFLQRNRDMFDYNLFDGVVTLNDIVTLVPEEVPILEVTFSTSQQDGAGPEEESRELLHYHAIEQLIRFMEKAEASTTTDSSITSVSVVMTDIGAVDPEEVQWVLYCTESDIDMISDGLKIITKQPLAIQPVLLIPAVSKGSDVEANATAIPVEDAKGQAFIVDEPIIVTTRALWINFVQQSWGECRDEMLRNKEAEETIVQVSKVASITLLVLVVASMCSSCISCGSLFVFLSIWCQQRCWRPWQERKNASKKQSKKSSKSSKKNPKKVRRNKQQQHSARPENLEFESVEYDSDASEASSVSSQRSFV